MLRWKKKIHQKKYMEDILKISYLKIRDRKLNNFPRVGKFDFFGCNMLVLGNMSKILGIENPLVLEGERVRPLIP